MFDLNKRFLVHLPFITLFIGICLRQRQSQDETDRFKCIVCAPIVTHNGDFFYK